MSKIPTVKDGYILCFKLIHNIFSPFLPFFAVMKTRKTKNTDTHFFKLSWPVDNQRSPAHCLNKVMIGVVMRDSDNISLSFGELQTYHFRIIRIGNNRGSFGFNMKRGVSQVSYIHSIGRIAKT